MLIFVEVLVLAAMMKDVSNSWKWIDFVNHTFVEFAKIFDHTDHANFLGMDKTLKDANCFLTDHFLLVDRNIILRDCVLMFAMIWDRAQYQVDVKLSFLVATNATRKQYAVLVEYGSKIIALCMASMPS
jgi:hypothetical protein